MPIKVDGIVYSLKDPDVDGDGQTGGTENLERSFNNDIQPINQPTELGETLRDFNRDDIEPTTRMTSIDLRTRIGNIYERNALMAIDALVALKFLPSDCLSITRQTKRLNVSMKGEGRKEVVDIVAGKREHDKQMGNGGIVNGIKSFFGGSQNGA